MKAVIQRVKRTALYVDGKLISEIPFGLAVFLGVKAGDSIATLFPPAALTNSINASGFMSRPIFVFCQFKYVSFAASILS